MKIFDDMKKNYLKAAATELAVEWEAPCLGSSAGFAGENVLPEDRSSESDWWDSI